MSEPYLGQIQTFGFNFPPRGWARCDGQILSIASNSALFSLLGTTFGGDGRTTFALPDLRGRDAVHVGTGPGLPPVSWGQRGGTHTYNLTTNQMPPHGHSQPEGKMKGTENAANSNNPEGKSPGLAPAYSTSGPSVEMADGTVVNPNTDNTGGGQSINVTEPYLGIYHCIALVGLFPSRN